MGFAGNWEPQYIIPTAVATPTKQVRTHWLAVVCAHCTVCVSQSYGAFVGGLEDQDYRVGNEVGQHDIMTPLQRAMLTVLPKPRRVTVRCWQAFNPAIMHTHAPHNPISHGQVRQSLKVSSSDHEHCRSPAGTSWRSCGIRASTSISAATQSTTTLFWSPLFCHLDIFSPLTALPD